MENCLKVKYENEVCLFLIEKFDYFLVMVVFKFEKIVLNMGVGDVM